MSESTTEVEEKSQDNIELSKDSKDILSKIETMSVLELSNLVKALEDKFGVVAAAPVAVAAGAPQDAGSAGADAADATVDVTLTDVGDKKIQVLKVVREITGLGLKEAKEIVDNVPKTIKEGLSKEEADEVKKKLEEQGGKVEVK